MNFFSNFDGPAARNHLTELVIGSQFDRFNTFVANPPKKVKFSQLSRASEQGQERETREDHKTRRH